MRAWMKPGTECIEPRPNSWWQCCEPWFDNVLTQYWFDAWVQATLNTWYWPSYWLGSASSQGSNLCQTKPAEHTDIHPTNVKLPPTQ